MGKNSIKNVYQRWNGEKGARNVWPGEKEWPDSDAPKILRKLCEGKICEIGCGTGRVANIFNADTYIGLDINKTAISEAKQKYPKHEFHSMSWNDSYPQNISTYLFYTILLHIPDDEISSIAKRVNPSAKIVILESMNRSLRKSQWQREPEEYAEIFDKEIISHQHLTSKSFPFFRDFLVLDNI